MVDDEVGGRWVDGRGSVSVSGGDRRDVGADRSDIGPTGNTLY